MNDYLTKYILKNKFENSQLGYFLKFEFDRRLYHYGDHFIAGYEMKSKRQLKSMFRSTYLKMSLLLKSTHNFQANTLVSNAYVSRDQKITSNNLNFVSAPWLYSKNSQAFFSKKIYKDCLEMNKLLEHSHFNQLHSDDFFNFATNLIDELELFYSNPKIVGGLFSNDLGFFERASIAILKKLKKKSFLMIHGIPAVYNVSSYTSSDYLLVWGEGIKDIFVKYGYSGPKVKVIGHPFLRYESKEVKSSLDSVLILGSSMPGGQFDDSGSVLWDRGNIILYCYLLQDVLKKLGVKKAVLRPHPSENASWYKDYIDLNFFELDTSKNLSEAIIQSSLVIGPSSTSFLESLCLGVNYIVFEPFTKTDFPLVAPFDGSDPGLLVAKSVDELFHLLKNNLKSNADILPSYLGSKNELDFVINNFL